MRAAGAFDLFKSLAKSFLRCAAAAAAVLGDGSVGLILDVDTLVNL